MKIISFTLKKSVWLESQPKSENCNLVKTPINSLRLEDLEIFSFTFHFLVHFLYTDQYTHASLSSDGHGYIRHIPRRIINPFPI